MKIYAIIAIVFGCLIITANWVYFFKSLKTKKFISTIPLFGALFLGLGLAYFEQTRKYAFLSIFVDWGTIILLAGIPNLISELYKNSRFCLSRKFVGKTETATYELNLYKYGYFVMKIKYTTPQLVNNHEAKIRKTDMAGQWTEADSTIELCSTYGKSFRLVSDETDFRLQEPNSLKHNTCLDGISLTLQKS